MHIVACSNLAQIFCLLHPNAHLQSFPCKPDPAIYSSWSKSRFSPTTFLFITEYHAQDSYQPHPCCGMLQSRPDILQCTLKYFLGCLTKESCAHFYFRFSPTTFLFILEYRAHTCLLHYAHSGMLQSRPDILLAASKRAPPIISL